MNLVNHVVYKWANLDRRHYKLARMRSKVIGSYRYYLPCYKKKLIRIEKLMDVVEFKKYELLKCGVNYTSHKPSQC